jgi:glycosyltransferase involved in cell wall biosynthesis
MHLDCALAGRVARRPVVVELHDLVRPGFGRGLLATAARLASRTVAISHAVADCAHPVPAGRIVVVPQAVDLQRFTPGACDPAVRQRLTSAPDAHLVGIVGRIDPEKGIGLLVEAMARLQGQAASAHLAVVGAAGVHGADYQESVRREAERLLGDRVRFTGPAFDVPATLRALDVVVNASSAEPFGLSILEAQACGRPVLALRAGGIPEFITDGYNGVLVDTPDPGMMASALETLLADEDRRRSLAAAGMETAESRHGLDTRAATVAEIYRDACARVSRHVRR